MTTTSKPADCPVPEVKRGDKAVVVIDSIATGIAMLIAFGALLVYMISRENEPQNLRIKNLEDNAMNVGVKLDKIANTLSEMNSAIKVIQAQTKGHD